jgi:hypothetical protein
MSTVVSTAVGIFILVNFNTDAAKVAAAFLMPSQWESTHHSVFFSLQQLGN